MLCAYSPPPPPRGPTRLQTYRAACLVISSIEPLQVLCSAPPGTRTLTIAHVLAVLGFGLCSSRCFEAAEVMQVLWCPLCQAALAWSLMADAESPATMFELLYLGFPSIESNIIYDNGCHLLDYMLNRDPEWARDKRVYIDALHAKGHVACATSLDTGAALLQRRWGVHLLTRRAAIDVIRWRWRHAGNIDTSSRGVILA